MTTRLLLLKKNIFQQRDFYRWKNMLVRTVGWKQFDSKYEIHDIKYCCIQYLVNKKKITYKVQNTERIQDAQITNLT